MSLRVVGVVVLSVFVVSLFRCVSRWCLSLLVVDVWCCLFLILVVGWGRVCSCYVCLLLLLVVFVVVGCCCLLFVGWLIYSCVAVCCCWLVWVCRCWLFVLVVLGCRCWIVGICCCWLLLWFDVGRCLLLLVDCGVFFVVCCCSVSSIGV